MEKRIEYQGMTSQPSDYVCPDGDMKLAVNAEYREGGWKAVREAPLSKKGNKKIFFIHKVNGHLIYIVENNGILSALEEDKEIKIARDIKTDEVDADSFFCIGKVIMFLLNKIPFFILYNNNEYVVMEQYPNFLELQFGVNFNGYTTGNIEDTYMEHSDCLKNSKDDTSYELYKSSEYHNINDVVSKHKSSDAYKNLVNYVFSSVNELRKREIEENRLLFPVFLSYALKMYDGNYICASTPVLIYPTSNPISADISERVYSPGYSTNIKYEKFHFLYNSYDIVFRILPNGLEALNNIVTKFKNVIKSIDFFLSEEIVNLTFDEFDVNIIDDYKKILDWNKHSLNDYTYWNLVNRFKYKPFKTCLESVSSFHLVASYSIDRFKSFYKLGKTFSQNSFAKLIDYGGYYNEVISDSLYGYTEREPINLSSLQYKSFIKAEGSYIYNNRNIIYNIFNTFELQNPSVNFCYISNSKPKEEGDNLSNDYDSKSNGELKLLMHRKLDKILVRFLNNDGCEALVSYESDDKQNVIFPAFFPYPNGSAENIFVKFNEDKNIYKINMNVHPILNFNYSLCLLNNIEPDKVEDFPQEVNNTFFEGNKLIMSEVNNPFVFKTTSFVSVGNGQIMALSANSLATSQGQFGQYPLYAFCTDGVYSIGIGTDGTLQNCVPLSYDILTDKHSVGKMEQVVVFATREGIIALSGSERKVLLAADKEADYKYDNDKQKDFITKTVNNVVGITPPQMTDLYTYITTGVRFAFDANHGRLIAFNPAYNYSYIMDAKTNNWSVFYKGFDSVLNIPEQCLLVRKETNDDGETEYNVYDYSSDEVVDIQKSYFITRPFKLDMPDVHKSIQSIIQRGVFCDRKDVQQALYGSNDLYNWTPVWSSKDIYLRGMRGSGYKYYKLAIFIPKFKQDEILHGCSVEFTPRLTNKPR